MPRPIFMLVADDEPRREALHRDLSRRYEADYEVISVASSGAALARLAAAAAAGAEVALLIADEHLAGLHPRSTSWPWRTSSTAGPRGSC